MNQLYQKRRRSKADVSRVNWRKTRVSLTSCLDDSESGTSTPSTSSDSESEWDDEESEEDSPPEGARAGTRAGTRARDHKRNNEGSEAEEVCAVPPSRRKRLSTTILSESSDDSDSDVGGQPVRKLQHKKRRNLEHSDSESEAAAAKLDAQKKAAEVKETAAKRRERRNKLLELSKKRRSRPSRPSRRRAAEGSSDAECPGNDENDDDDDDDENIESTSRQETHSHEEEEEAEEGDKDSLKDFIVESDEGGEGSSVQGAEGSVLSHYLPKFVPGSMLTHFQVAVKAFLINALDETFLKSLYDGERTKKYALEMKDSLYHLEQRSILPRLENLKQRSRWSNRYKERVDCYPKVRVLMTGVRDQSCQACQLHRTCRFTVQLSGQLYDNKTLKHDEFMPDDTQAFQVGNVCARRTEVYHQLKHFQYHLFRHCQAVLKEEVEEEGTAGEDEEEAVKDTVVRVLTKLQTSGWITAEYEKFQDYLNDADYFQEEKLD